MAEASPQEGDLIAFCAPQPQSPRRSLPSAFTIGAVVSLESPAVLSVIALVQGHLTHAQSPNSSNTNNNHPNPSHSGGGTGATAFSCEAVGSSHTAANTPRGASNRLTPTELLEMQEQQESLSTDIAKSKQRIASLQRAIDVGTAAVASQSRSEPTLSSHELQMALRKVQATLAKDEDWENTRKTISSSSSNAAFKALVSTVETAAALGDLGAPYAELTQHRELLQRLSAVPVSKVKAKDVAAAEKSLAQHAKVAKDLPPAARQLRLWMRAMVGCWKDKYAGGAGGKTESTSEGRRSASADPKIAQQLERDRHQLQEEREILELAEEELQAVTDILQGHEAQKKTSSVKPVRVQLPWVLCVLTRHIPTAQWQQWQELPEGTALTLPDGAARALRLVLAPSPAPSPESHPLLADATVRKLSATAVPTPLSTSPAPTATAATAAVKRDSLSLAATEVELLREELQACRADLQRVKDERDTLLYSKRSHRSVSRTAGSHADPNDEKVDRSIADELEEQLNMAYERIKELEAKSGQQQNYHNNHSNNHSSSLNSPVMGRQPSVSFAGVPPLVLNRDDPLTPRPAPATVELSILVPPSIPPPLPTSFSPTGTPTAERGELRASQRALQDRVAELEKELEVQQRVFAETNEQLNVALNGQAEAQLRADQLEKEVEAMWGKLEDAEARLHDEIQSGDRRVSLAQQQQQQQQHPQDPYQPPQQQSRNEVSFSMPTVVTTDGKAPSPPPSSMPRMTTNVMTADGRSLPSPSRRDSYLSTAMQRRESRAPAPTISLQPVEQMTPIELRHEVRVLRQEVERHQSIELRLTNELQLVREKQREERRRRQDAREARLQMLTRLQDAVQEAMVKPNEEMGQVQVLLESTRLECNESATKRRLSLSK